MKLVLLALTLCGVTSRQISDLADPCSGIRCPEITCSSGKLLKPEGKCCQECEDPCLSMRCPEFTKCATNEYKTTAWCEETCDNNGKCAEDEVCEIVTDSTAPQKCQKKSICKTTHHCNLMPTSIKDLCLSYDGTDRCKQKNFPFCTQVDVYDYSNGPWSRVYVCSCRDYGLKWSNYGPISNMVCTQINETVKTTWGENRYVCIPKSWPFRLIWSSNGIPIGTESNQCMEWKIPGDRSWHGNYLCEVTPPKLTDFRFSNNGPIPSYTHYRLHSSVMGSKFTNGWENNFLCSREDYGLEINFGSPIYDMHCTRMTPCNVTSWWSDPYICSPYWWNWYFDWSPSGTPHKSLECLDIEEPEHPEFSGSLCKVKTCPVTECFEECPTGYIYDEFGCNTCKCKPDQCAFVQCPRLSCDNYRWDNGMCCPSCLQTFEDTTCPKLLDCFVKCPYGFKKDAAGCDICECHENPCETHECLSHEECFVESTTFKPFCVETCKNYNLCARDETCIMKTPPCNKEICFPVPVCEKTNKIEEIERVECTMSCPGGFRSFRDYPSCSCRPDDCAGVVCPPTPMCESPVYVGDECCPRCPPVCPQIKCTVACISGYELDDFGCQTCTCRPDACLGVSCPTLTCTDKVNVFGECCMKCRTDVSANCPLMKCVPCPHGYYTDYNGCQTCTCKPDYCSKVSCENVVCDDGKIPIYKPGSCCPVCPGKDECPKISCDMFCPYGYEYDSNGCMTCKCNPISCQSVRCTTPTRCPRPVYIPGKCCPVCPESKPMVAFSDGYYCKHWDLRVGRWQNDMITQFHYPTGRTQILQKCKEVYPGMVFWDVKLSKEPMVIRDWCPSSERLTDSCFSATEKCTVIQQSLPYHCIGAEFHFPVDFYFGYGYEDQRRGYCEVIRSDSGIGTQNHFCSYHQMPFHFSYLGPIEGMRCTKIDEPHDITLSWNNTYICFPNTFEYRFKWFNTGLPDGYNENICVRWSLMTDGYIQRGWENNWLCSDTEYTESVLSNFICDKHCPYGFKTKTSQTMIGFSYLCECNEDPCSDFICSDFQECMVDRPTGKPFCADTCKDNGKCDTLETCELRVVSCFTSPCPRVAICKPKCPVFKSCSLSCPGGFIEDFLGCPVCKCKPMNCSNINCLRPMCDKPVTIEGQCCPVCPAKCRHMQLTRYCPGGYEMDAWGCYIDMCKPDICATTKCPIPSCKQPVSIRGVCCPNCSSESISNFPEEPCSKVCPGGLYKNRLGRTTCTCKPDYCSNVECTPCVDSSMSETKPGDCCPRCKEDFCPHRPCSILCKHGYETDLNGCPLCKCKPAYCSVVEHERPSCDHPVSLMSKCGLYCPTKARGYECPELLCLNPVYVDGEPCPQCPSVCQREVRCTSPCATGYEYDNDGCMTCRCKPDRCLSKKCLPLSCDFPVWKRGSCCPTCDCDRSSCRKCPMETTTVDIKGKCCPRCIATKKPVLPYICPAVRKCTNACPGGYEFDVYGCPTCTCKPTKCKDERCPTLFKCDFPVHYEGECCKRCPPQFRYKISSSFVGYQYKACPKLKCEQPVFIRGSECPVCPMRPRFPTDFFFSSSFDNLFLHLRYDLTGWEIIKMDWDFTPRVSYLVTAMPMGMRWSSKGPIHGMRCTYIGKPKETYEEMATWLCVPEWSDIYTKFYWNTTLPEITDSQCIKINDIDTTWPLSWLCREDDQIFVPSDFQFTYRGSEYLTRLGWTCLAITPMTTEYGWNNNFMCTRKNLGWQWSNDGRIDGMTCYHMQSSATGWGESNYLCVPQTSDLEIFWTEKRHREMYCIKWEEPKHNSWGDHYLCIHKKECLNRRMMFNSCDLDCDNYEVDQDGCPICRCKIETTPCKSKICPFGFKKDEFGVDTCQCRPWPCLNMKCKLSCENGYEYSTSTGCAECQCKPNGCTSEVMKAKWKVARMSCSNPVTLPKECDYRCPINYSPSPWCASGQCPILPCKEPMKVKGECCPKCPPVCQKIRCSKFCINGYQQDRFGCPTCTCNPQSVATMRWLTGCPNMPTCRRECEFGYYFDRNGCKTCECVQEKCAFVSCPTPTCSDPIRRPDECCYTCQEELCSEKTCKDPCPGGYEYDERGCRTCNCKPDNCDWWDTKLTEESQGCDSDWQWKWWRKDAWWWQNNGMSWRNNTWWWNVWQRNDCDNALSVVNQCTPYCPKREDVCPDITCSRFCFAGYVKDRDGCDTCRCLEDLTECPTLTCDLRCPDGYEQDSKGCDVCQCKTTTTIQSVSCPTRCTYEFCSRNLHSLCSVNEDDLDREYRRGRCSGTSDCCVTSCKACHFGRVDSVRKHCTPCQPEDQECIAHFGHCARNFWCRREQTINSTSFPCVRFGDRGSDRFGCAYPNF